jgi:hypothetical protein
MQANSFAEQAAVTAGLWTCNMKVPISKLSQATGFPRVPQANALFYTLSGNMTYVYNRFTDSCNFI